MKQLLFFKNVMDNNIPVWYKNMTYQVIGENEETYKLFCEDMKVRRIHKILEHEIFEVI